MSSNPLHNYANEFISYDDNKKHDTGYVHPKKNSCLMHNPHYIPGVSPGDMYKAETYDTIPHDT